MRRIKLYWFMRDTFWVLWNAMACFGIVIMCFIAWALFNYVFIW